MKLAALALVALVVFTAAAAAADDARTRFSVELGAGQARARGDTPLNPGGELIDAGERAANVSARLQAQRSFGGLRLVLDAWAEARRVDGDNDLDLVTNEALAEYAFTPATSVAAGVTLARWGTGYSWNPANPVQDPEANNTSRARTYRRDGDPVLRVETGFGRDSGGLYLTNFKQNDPLLSPLRQREWSLVGRYQHVIDGGDITGFAAFGRHERFAGVAASMTVGEQLELHGELGLRSRRRAPEVMSVLLPAGSGAATLPLWQTAPRSQATAALLLGGQYTFETRTNVIAEYAYNGNGYSNGEFAALRDAAAAGRALLNTPLDAAGRGFLLDANRLVGRLRRHYLFVRVAQDEIARDTDLHYYLRAGLADGAQVHGLLLRHTLRQGTSLQLGAEFYAGPERSEARLIPVRHRIEATLAIAF